MVRSVVSKVMWVGRATVFMVGLAVIVALVLGVATAAFGANGDPFILGKAGNSASRVTGVVGNVADETRSALRVRNSGPGSALELRVGDPAVAPESKLTPPMKVDSQARVANLNADQIDGTDSSSLIRRGSSGSATPLGMNFYSYFMNTGSVNDYPFGQAKLQTTGTAGQFRVCGNSSATGSFNYVAYVNGTRTAGTVSTGGCSSAFDAGAGGDFQVSIRRVQIFGVHSGDSTTNENYNLYGFSQL